MVTGGAGFVGSHLTETLLKQGKDVRILDNFSSGNWRNIETAAGLEVDKNNHKDFYQIVTPHGSHLEVIVGDLRDPKAIQSSLRGIKYIFHHAAIASVAHSIADPIGCNQVNVDGTLYLLTQAKEAGVRRVVYAASASAYGLAPGLPKHEEMKPQPASPYAVSKLAGEDYCRIFPDLYGLSTVVLRYFNIFGPRQDPLSEYASVIPKFIQLIANDQTPTIYGDGEQTRDFVYIDDIVKANLLAMDGGEDLSGETFNIGCGEEISLNKLIKELSGIFHKEVKPDYTDPRPGDIKFSVADISKAAAKLGYRPGVTLAEGLEKTVNYFSNR